MIIGKAMINYQLDYLNSLDYFRRLLDCFRYINKKDLGKTEEFIDSFSNNQFQSKRWLIDEIDKLNLISNETKVAVLGCWFGSVLFPDLLKRNVNMIYGYEIDKYVIEVSNMLFEKLDKVQFINQDIWIKKPRYIDETNMIINTSCEHMPPMKYWDYYKHGIYVFQSTNIDEWDHINCVKNIDDFKNQMHPMLEILWSGTQNVEYTENGKRFMIIGKM